MVRFAVCPFCEERTRIVERVVRCRSCGEAFEPEPEEYEFSEPNAYKEDAFEPF